MTAEVWERSGSSTGGTKLMTKELSPRSGKHPVASSTRATWLPSRTPPRGSKEGKCFMDLGKKKLCQWVLALLAPPPCPASAWGPGGGPSPPSLLLAHGGGCGVRDPGLCLSRTPESHPGSCQDVTQGQSLFPGAQRETEAGDVLGLAAPCSLWGGGATRNGPSSPPRAGPGL